MKRRIDAGLKLEAEELDKTLDTEITNDLEKNFVDEGHKTENEGNDVANNRKTEDAAQQFSNQVEDLAQQGKNVSLDHNGNELEDELNELKDNLFGTFD